MLIYTHTTPNQKGDTLGSMKIRLVPFKTTTKQVGNVAASLIQ